MTTVIVSYKIVINFVAQELFEDIALQIAEIRTVAKSLPLNFQNSAKCLFLNRLSQTENNLKYAF